MAGQHVRVRVGSDSRYHPDEDILSVAPRNECLEPVDVVGVVDDDKTHAVLEGGSDLLVGLGIAVVHDQCGVDPGLDCGADLAASGHVEPESLLDHHPLDGGTREGLGREDHTRVRPPGGELVDVLPGPGAHGLFRDHQDRRAELLGQVVGAAASHEQRPVVRHCAAGGEQREQVGHHSV